MRSFSCHERKLKLALLRFVQLATEKQTLLHEYNFSEASLSRSSSESENEAQLTDGNDIGISPCKMKPLSQNYRRMEEHNGTSHQYLLQEIQSDVESSRIERNGIIRGGK